ncbi:hypothetical protein BP5796_12123 [Coleophoma crateriformis]|uniref:Uncharacterized protein n=1 Tax=Coleophoma crateriformis TaxID=565419 RepID=A0A3D8QBP3_9HELO|nr:hypothetical protein BP5796_12123 [Coleophoma crateriformis]
MRLLNTHNLKIDTFFGNTPGYAVLSHTWGDYEVTFREMESLGGKEAVLSAMLLPDNRYKDYNKIVCSAEFARTRGFDYIWIDTCCIDKSSSAELSEAINSMFSWYKDAEICYAYLADVFQDHSSRFSEKELSKSRWFTRGWTLQELIAPKEVIFVSKSWQVLGTRRSLKHLIWDVTKVNESVLDGVSLDTIATGVKMSWASSRNTTRPEDTAYCLLGLFNVNMPLLYGEGKQKAFLRLQQEILRDSDDESIFAWRTSQEESQEKPYWGILAPTPDYFIGCGSLKRPRFVTRREGQPTMITNHGVRVELSLAPFRGDKSGTIFLAVLDCDVYNTGTVAAIIIQRLSDYETQYARIARTVLLEISLGLYRVPRESLNECFMVELGLGKSRGLYMSRIDEPEPQYLFVRLVPTHSRLLAGFYLEPGIAFPSVWRDNDKFVLSIHDPAQPWEEWGESDHRYHKIDLDHEYLDTTELDQLEASHRKERKVLGCLGVRVALTRGNDSERWSKPIYFVVGFGPLPENPFSTPSGYVKPWYSFARGQSAQSILQRFTHESSPRILERENLPDDYSLSINFTVGTRFAKVYYKVNVLVSKNDP